MDRDSAVLRQATHAGKHGGKRQQRQHAPCRRRLSDSGLERFRSGRFRQGLRSRGDVRGRWGGRPRGRTRTARPCSWAPSRACNRTSTAYGPPADRLPRLEQFLGAEGAANLLVFAANIPGIGQIAHERSLTLVVSLPLASYDRGPTRSLPPLPILMNPSGLCQRGNTRKWKRLSASNRVVPTDDTLPAGNLYYLVPRP